MMISRIFFSSSLPFDLRHRPRLTLKRLGDDLTDPVVLVGNDVAGSRKWFKRLMSDECDLLVVDVCR
jgi:hypothetical protein